MHWLFAKNSGSRLPLLHVFEGLPESPYLHRQMATLRLRELVSQRVDLGRERQTIVEMGSPWTEPTFERAEASSDFGMRFHCRTLPLWTRGIRTR